MKEYADRKPFPVVVLEHEVRTLFDALAKELPEFAVDVIGETKTRQKRAHSMLEIHSFELWWPRFYVTGELQGVCGFAGWNWYVTSLCARYGNRGQHNHFSLTPAEMTVFREAARQRRAGSVEHDPDHKVNYQHKRDELVKAVVSRIRSQTADAETAKS